MKYLIFALLFVFPTFALADNTINIDGDGTFTYTETITMNLSCDTYKDFVIFNPSGYALGGLVCDPSESPYIFNTSVQDLDNWLITSEVLGTYTILAVDMVNPPSDYNDVCINYDETDELTGCLSIFPTPIATFTLIAEGGGGNSTWGSNGIWGDISTTEVKDTLVAGVASTGQNIWPLIALVGIPVGFFIVIMLIYAINQQLTPVPLAIKKRRGRRKKYDLIYHSAEDLEFKRNYGQSKEL